MKTLKARILAFSLSLIALAALGCGGSSSSPPESGPQVLPVGGGTLVVATQDSLSAARPGNDGERTQALADYFRDHPDLFGPSGQVPAPPTFLPAGSPSRMVGPTGERWTLLALNQIHLGAPVIDEMQMGAFLERAGGDLLRRARGNLRDPSTLPTPPDPMTAPRDRVLPVADALIVKYGLAFDRTVVGDIPVISVRHGIAGYLVSEFRPTRTGSFERFRAIVDPRDLRVEVLEFQDACDGCPTLPLGAEVAATTVPPFPPPAPIAIRRIRVHAVRLSDGDGSNQAPITPGQVKKWVDATNAVWWPQAGIYFTFDAASGSPDFEDWNATLLNSVPADSGEDHLYKIVGNVWSLLFHHKKMVVFFRARGGGGWSWGPTSTFFISMPSYGNTAIYKPDSGGYISNDTALSHEVGHYLGLAHTFSGGDCPDVVPATSNGDVGGQDPTTTADDVLDTLPDMRDGCYPTDSLTCTGGIVVLNGLLWNPPWANVMSYHDCLPEELTTDQVAAIEHALLDPVRANLLD